MIVVGIGGGARNGAVAVTDAGRLAGICAQTTASCSTRAIRKKRATEAAIQALLEGTAGRLVRLRDGVGPTRQQCALYPRESDRAVSVREPQSISEALVVNQFVLRQ